MKEYISLKTKRKQQISYKIKQTLEKEEAVVFAYVYGSFLNAPSFRDIDIGIYTKNISSKQQSRYEIELAKKISVNCNLPIDYIEITTFNFAPDSFINNVVRTGQLIFSRNNLLLSDLIEKISLTAIANEYLSNQSLKELLPA